MAGRPARDGFPAPPPTKGRVEDPATLAGRVTPTDIKVMPKCQINILKTHCDSYDAKMTLHEL